MSIRDILAAAVYGAIFTAIHAAVYWLILPAINWPQNIGYWTGALFGLAASNHYFRLKERNL